MHKQNGFEKSYLCTCVRVNSICSKLEGIFKHIGLMPWTHAWSAMAFIFQKIRKILKDVRGSYLPIVIKHALFPLGTTSLLVSCSGL